MNLAERDYGHKMRGTYPKPEVIPDLTRPNFGDQDEEVKFTQKNIKDAEKFHEATLNAEFVKSKPIPDLRRPNFGELEQDVAQTVKHTHLAEKEYNHKMRG